MYLTLDYMYYIYTVQTLAVSYKTASYIITMYINISSLCPCLSYTLLCIKYVGYRFTYTSFSFLYRNNIFIYNTYIHE